MEATIFTDSTRLNLIPNVIYVALMDADTTMGKIISISGNKTYKPNNKTAALLLYLLARDINDGILFPDFVDLVQKKFPGVSTGQITDFLNKLDNYHVLHMDSGKSAGDLDPLDLFNPSSPATWQTPDLTLGNPPTCKANTFYSSGYIIVPIRR